MTFRELVRSTRERKKEYDPKAYTQAACGSRMTDANGNLTPIGQVGWSRFETEDFRPNFDTVIGIATALNESPDAFLRAADYPIQGEADVYSSGKLTLQDEDAKRRELEALKQQLADMQVTLDRLLSPC